MLQRFLGPRRWPQPLFFGLLRHPFCTRHKHEGGISLAQFCLNNNSAQKRLCGQRQLLACRTSCRVPKVNEKPTSRQASQILGQQRLPCDPLPDPPCKSKCVVLHQPRLMKQSRIPWPKEVIPTSLAILSERGAKSQNAAWLTVAKAFATGKLNCCFAGTYTACAM